MKYMKALPMAMLLILSFTISVNAQDYPRLTNVSLHCHVSLDAQKGTYFYTYDMYNHSNSRGKVFELLIDVSARSKVSNPDTTGLVFQDSFVEGLFRKTYPMVQGKIVPVGFSSSPLRWYGALAVSKEATFGGYPLVEPGDSLKGNIMMSKGLPSIRKFTAKPSFNIEKYFPSIEDTSRNSMTTTEMDSIRNSLNYNSFTVGPSLPPDPINEIVFVDTLTSYLARSCTELGWIENQGLCRSLEAKLESLEQQLDRGNTWAASGALKAFINEVEAQKDKQLSPEAYALLYINGRYLLDRLQ